MIIKHLKENTLEAFKDFCRKHKTIHDESYLYEEDLDDLDLEIHPTLLLYDQDKIIGVLSVMLDPYFLKASKSRIRIFYCESGLLSHYTMLLEAMPRLKGIKTIEAFLPVHNEASIQIFSSLGFSYYRTAYIMKRAHQDQPTYNFPDSYTLKPFVKDRDEVHFQTIRNEAFKTLKGSEQALDMDMVKKITSADYLIKDGIQLLYFKDHPIGLVRVEEDQDVKGKFSFIAPIALLPDHQGKGLGKELLNAGISLGYDCNLETCQLCVNAENEQALSLYKRAGFVIDEAIGCYHLKYNS